MLSCYGLARKGPHGAGEILSESGPQRGELWGGGGPCVLEVPVGRHTSQPPELVVSALSVLFLCFQNTRVIGRLMGNKLCSNSNH